MSTVGNAIRSRREQLNMTQEELAHKIGFTSRTGVSKLEKGQTEPSIDRLKLLAEALDTTVEYLIYGPVAYNRSLGDYQENRDYLRINDPSLIPYLEELSNPEKRILFDKIKELEPQDVASLLRVVKMIEEGK
ncbi:helix-turn-helix domain-containing protein [Faecalibaculum rodentium]|uniref:helix-turn-helix domain-containing protein n=1 Tax=Faecalibaculum rodentium TaxID=1702221 RepID=UPI002612B35C|nr:helix-turn-helix transcriptional regulator [Faecalibaculum rodentium]